MPDLNQQIQILISGKDELSDKLAGVTKQLDAVSAAMARINQSGAGSAAGGMVQGVTQTTAAYAQMATQSTAAAAAIQRTTQTTVTGAHGFAQLTAATNQLGGALGLHGGTVNQFGHGIQTLTGYLSPATAGVVGLGAAFVGIAAAIAHASQEMEHQQAITKGYLESQGAGGGLQKAIDGIEQYRVKAKSLGVTFTDLNEGFRRAFEHADDIGKALEADNLALNIAAINGQTYHQVLNRLDAAMEGNVRSLRLLGVHLNDTDNAYLKSLEPAKRYEALILLLKERYQNLEAPMNTTKTAMAELEVRFEKMVQNSGKGLNEMLGVMARAAVNAGDGVDRLAKAVGGFTDSAANAMKNPAVMALLAGLPGAQQVLGVLGSGKFDWGAAAASLPGAGVIVAGVNALAGSGPSAAGSMTGGGEFADPSGRTQGDNRAAWASVEAEKFHALGEARKHVLEGIESTKKQMDEFFRQQEQGVRDSEASALRALEAGTRNRRQALEERERDQRAAFQAERQTEDERHRLATQDLQIREEAERQSLARRKREEETAYANYVRDTERQREADLKRVDAQEKMALDSINKRQREETRDYERRKQQLDDEVRDRQQATEHEKQDIDRATTAFVQDRERRKQAVVDGVKAEEKSLQDRYERERQLSQDAVAAADRAHQQLVRQIEDEHRAAVRAIEDETDRLVKDIAERKRANDDASKARNLAEQTDDAAHKLQQEQRKLTELQLKGATPQEIADQRRAVFEAERKQADLYYNEQERLRQQALDDEEKALKDAVSAKKQELDDKAGAEKRAADDALALVRDTEEAKQRALKETYDRAKELLDQRVTDEERAAAAEIQTARNAAQQRKDQLDAELEDYRNNKRAEMQALEAQHKDFQDKMADVERSTKAVYDGWKDHIRTTAQQAIDDRRRQHEADQAAFAEETESIQSRYSAERREEASTHAQKMASIQTAEAEFGRAIAAERQKLEDEYRTMRDQIRDTFGDVPGGKLRAINEAKRGFEKALDDEADAIKKHKGDRDTDLAYYQAKAQLIDQIAARSTLAAAGVTGRANPTPMGVGPDGEAQPMGSRQTAAAVAISGGSVSGVSYYNQGAGIASSGRWETITLQDGTTTDASGICGPVAFQAFASYFGRPPSIAEALQIAKDTGGWSQSRNEANGVIAMANTMQKYGLPVDYSTGNAFGIAQQQLSQGRMAVISTPAHYFVATGYDPNTGLYDVGSSGTVMKGGASRLTQAQITQLGRGVNGVIYDTGQRGAGFDDYGSPPDLPTGAQAVTAAQAIISQSSAARLNPLGYSGDAVPVFVVNMGSGGWNGGYSGSYGGVAASPAGAAAAAAIAAAGLVIGAGGIEERGSRWSPPRGQPLRDPNPGWSPPAHSRRMGGVAYDDFDVDLEVGGRGRTVPAPSYVPRTAADFGLNPFQATDPRFKAVIDSYNLNQRELIAAQERIKSETLDSERKSTQATIDKLSKLSVDNIAELERLRTTVGQGLSGLSQSFQAMQSVFTSQDNLLPGGTGGIGGQFNTNRPTNPASFNPLSQANSTIASFNAMTNAQVWALGASLGLIYPHTSEDEPVPNAVRAEILRRYQNYVAGAYRPGPFGPDSPFDHDPGSEPAGGPAPGGGTPVDSGIHAGTVGDFNGGGNGSTGRGGALLRPVRGAASAATAEAAGSLDRLAPMLRDALRDALQSVGEGGNTFVFHIGNDVDVDRMIALIEEKVGRNIARQIGSGGRGLTLGMRR